MIDTTEVAVQIGCRECGDYFAENLGKSSLNGGQLCPRCQTVPPCSRLGCERLITGEIAQYNGRPRHLCCVPTMLYVNVYKVSLHYGGSQEGGWYYDGKEPIASVPVPLSEGKKTLQKKVKNLEKMFANHRTSQGPQGRHSTRGGCDIEVQVEETFAEYQPQEKPTYE